MITFIWVVSLMMLLETVAKIAVLASGRMLPRTPAAIAIDVVIMIGMLIWAAVVLS